MVGNLYSTIIHTLKLIAGIDEKWKKSIWQNGYQQPQHHYEDGSDADRDNRDAVKIANIVTIRLIGWMPGQFWKYSLA